MIMDEQKPFLTFVDPSDRESGTAAISETPTVTPAQRPTYIRTYHQDMTHVMGANNPRVMSEVLADVRHEEAVKESRTLVSPKNKLFLIGSILLILVGIGAIGFVLYRNYVSSLTLQQGIAQSLITAETNTNVTLVPNETYQNQQRIKTAFAVDLPLETINNIFFTRQTLAGLEGVSFADMVQATGGTVPAGLAATLDQYFMYGVYQTSVKQPFLIVRVNNYDDAFDGMRSWEPLLVRQLGFLFQLPDALQQSTDRSVFENKIIANRAVRAFVYRQQSNIQETPSAIEESEDTSQPTPETNSTETNADQDAATPDATATTEQGAQTELPVIETAVESVVPTTIVAVPEIPASESSVETSATTPETLPYQDGDTVLLYTFLNERTILIATSETVFREVLFRLTNAQLLL